MKVCLDLHDFSIINNRLDLLLKLKNHFPEFKVSLFTVPIEERTDWGPTLVRDDIASEVRKHLGWMQIIPHGFIHNGSEMRNADYRYFKEVTLHLIKRSLERDELPYENGFCAPHWRWNDGVVKALDEMGWWGAVDREKVMPYTRRYYKYNFLLNEPFYEAKEDPVKIHGHVYGTRNDLGKCFDNLLRLPKNTEWHFVTDFLEEK